MTAVHMTSTRLSKTCGFHKHSFPYFHPTDSSSCFLTSFSCFLRVAPNLLPAPASSVTCSTHLSHRNPLGLPISKRDSLLEKCAMFREAGGALSRQPSQDNGLDGPFGSGASKLEQVPKTQITSKTKDNS